MKCKLINLLEHLKNKNIFAYYLIRILNTLTEISGKSKIKRLFSFLANPLERASSK
jgi:competence protein ComGF